jgi:hypothetical protein
LKKLSLSLIALAALSGAAYANNHGSEMRVSDFYNVKKPTASATMTVVSPLAITEKDAALSAFERMMNNSEENQSGHDNGGRSSQSPEA